MTDIHFKTKLYSQEAYEMLYKASMLEDSIAEKRKAVKGLWWVPRREVWINFGSLKKNNDGEIVVDCPIDDSNPKNPYARNLQGRAAKFYREVLSKMLAGTFKDDELSPADAKLLVDRAVAGLDMSKLEILKKLIGGVDVERIAKKEGEAAVSSLVGHPHDPFVTSKNSTIRAEIEEIEKQMNARIAELEMEHELRRAKFNKMLSDETEAVKRPFASKIAKLQEMLK